MKQKKYLDNLVMNFLGIIYSTMSLFLTVAFLLWVSHANNWKMDKKYGAVLLVGTSLLWPLPLSTRQIFWEILMLKSARVITEYIKLSS